MAEAAAAHCNRPVATYVATFVAGKMTHTKCKWVDCHRQIFRSCTFSQALVNCVASARRDVAGSLCSFAVDVFGIRSMSSLVSFIFAARGLRVLWLFSKCKDIFGVASHNTFLRWANLHHSISMFPAASSSLCIPVRHNLVWRSRVKIITNFASVVSAIFKRNFKWWWEVELAARSTVANMKKLDECTPCPCLNLRVSHTTYKKAKKKRRALETRATYISFLSLV